MPFWHHFKASHQGGFSVFLKNGTQGITIHVDSLPFPLWIQAMDAASLQKISQLREEIAEHDKLYYKLAQPRIDDCLLYTSDAADE